MSLESLSVEFVMMLDSIIKENPEIGVIVDELSAGKSVDEVVSSVTGYTINEGLSKDVAEETVLNSSMADLITSSLGTLVKKYEGLELQLESSKAVEVPSGTVKIKAPEKIEDEFEPPVNVDLSVE